MRFLVLLGNAVVVASAFVALKEELCDAGERFYSTVGFAASIPVGAAYFVCISMSVASSVPGLAGKEALVTIWALSCCGALGMINGANDGGALSAHSAVSAVTRRSA